MGTDVGCFSDFFEDVLAAFACMEGSIVGDNEPDWMMGELVGTLVGAVLSVGSIDGVDDF